MNVFYVLCFIGWILSFGAWVFQFASKENTFLPLIIMWVFVALLWLTK